MTQTRKGSAIETATSTAIGYAVAIVAQIVILPLFGLRPTLGENAGIAAMFTAVSLVRGYCVRRLFVAIQARAFRRKKLAEFGAWVDEHYGGGE